MAWQDVASLLFGRRTGTVDTFEPIDKTANERNAAHVEDQHNQPLTNAEAVALLLSKETTQLLIKAKTDNLDIALTALRDALTGGKTNADIWATLQLQKELSESIWTDNTLAYFVRRVITNEAAGTITVSWTDASGNAVAEPGAGKRPLSSPDREVVQSLFTATAGGTGYVTGDILTRCLVLDTSVVPPSIAATLWFNISTGLAISTPTTGTYRQDLGLTAQELTAEDLAKETTLAAASAKLPATLGQKASAASLAAVLSTEQEAKIDLLAKETTLAQRNNLAATLLNLLPTSTGHKTLRLKGHGPNAQFDYHFRAAYTAALDVAGEALRFRRVGLEQAATYSRTTTTVTVTHTLAHNLESGDVVFHTGATDAGLDQELVKVTVTSALIYTYTTAATGTASGAITLQPGSLEVKMRSAVAMTALGSGW